MSFTLIISSGFTSFAKQEENNTRKKVEYLNNETFIELLSKSDIDYQIIGETQNNHFISKFNTDGKTFLVDETFDSNQNVESYFYLLKEDEKIYLGQQKTIIEDNYNNINIKIVEDNKVINFYKDKNLSQFIGMVEKYDGYDEGAYD